MPCSSATLHLRRIRFNRSWFRLRPRSRAKLTARNWWKCIGRRSCAMSHSPITPQIRRPFRRPRNSSMPTYVGPRDGNGNVTPDLFFRGTYPGRHARTLRLAVHALPTFLGAQPIDQQLTTYLAGRLHDRSDDLPTSPERHRHRRGRCRSIRCLATSLSAAIWAHLRVRMCFFRLILSPSWCSTRSEHRSIPVIPMSARPSKMASALSADRISPPRSLPSLAPRSTASGIKNGWFISAIVPSRAARSSGRFLTGNGNTLKGHVNDNVLNSQAVQSSFNKFGDYFLSQAFPEGSPTHPAYPTGHGTVAGACITVLKFFFDGDFVIPNPVVPTQRRSFARSLHGRRCRTTHGQRRTEQARAQRLLRSRHSSPASTGAAIPTSSIQLGEAVAISILQDRARTYAEPFTVSLTKIDGTIATISNQ